MITPPPGRVGHGGGDRQRTARASARAVFALGGLLGALLPIAGCRPAADGTATGAGDTRPRLAAEGFAAIPGASRDWAAATWDPVGDGWVGRLAGDTAVRWQVRPRRDDVATRRLCGFLATGSRLGARLPEGWPMDTLAPRLLIRTLEGADLMGIRYLTPGADAHYWFEGITRDGAWRVSMRWPVVSDPLRPLPASAPDSAIEAALTPSPRALDALAAALALPAESPWRPGALPTQADAEAGAVILARDYPDQLLQLSTACPQATVMLPVLARVDQRLRIPVRRGDRVEARGTVPDGAVRLAFDEAPPAPGSDPGERGMLRSPIPEAAITAAEDGRVTLRVRLLVVPRAQQAVQPVVVTVGVTPSRGPRG